MTQNYEDNGWIKFKYDAKLYDWLKTVSREVFSEIQNHDNRNNWLRYQGTWFAGVNVLKNNIQGAVVGGRRLDTDSSRWALEKFNVKEIKWDKGQVSVCYPGYPKPAHSESLAAFKYRLKNSASYILRQKYVLAATVQLRKYKCGPNIHPSKDFYLLANYQVEKV